MINSTITDTSFGGTWYNRLMTKQYGGHCTILADQQENIHPTALVAEVKALQKYKQGLKQKAINL